MLDWEPLQTYKTKWFGRFARREGIADSSLLEAIERAERGIIDADLGGGLIKQRVARKGQGRSGGYRPIGIGHSSRDIAEEWMKADAKRILRGILEGEIQEIANDHEKT